MRWRSLHRRAAVLALLVLCGTACHMATETSSPAARVDQPSPSARQGEAVAAELNRRYSDRKVKCGDDKPAYFCSGVVYRAIDSNRGHFWDNVQLPEYDGVSFSFARSDVGRRGSYRDTGYIFRPADEWGKDGGFPITMYCSFAFDGATGPERGVHGCGRFLDWEGTEPCADQGIDTVWKFARHYHSRSGGAKGPYQCSFGVSWQAFLLSILARQGGDAEGGSGDYTEQVLSNWPQGIPSRLPLEAIYYVVRLPGALERAQSMQEDFQAQTGEVLPIVGFHDLDMSVLPFSFDAEDQVKTGGVQPKRRLGSGFDGHGEPLNYHAMPR
jgi:hypothetical protein